MKDLENLNEIEKSFLLSEVATLYYVHNMTQSEIATRLFTSRSKISRLLKESREKSIVEIKINEPCERNLELEELLLKRFNLQYVRVLKNNNNSYEETLQKIGRLGAFHLENTIDKKTILGVSWGRTIYNTINSLNCNKNIPITVVQVMGSASKNNRQFDSLELTRRIAETYGGEYHYLTAPLFLDSLETKQILYKDPIILDTLNLAKHANMLLTGLGTIDTESSNSIWKGYLNSYSKHNLIANGSIGHICAHFIDSNGNRVNCDMNDKLVGIELEDLRKIENVVCLTCGKQKSKVLLSALKGGYINTLITDDTAVFPFIDELKVTS